MLNRPESIRCCVFDAYGTLFDVNAAAAARRDRLGGRWEELARLWRQKQLEYTWLRSLMGDFADFWQVTGDGLDYAMASLGMADPELREELMSLYLTLETYPEVPGVLGSLRDAGMRTAILSNGSRPMLDAAIGAAGIGPLLDRVLSVDDVGIYKPDPSVYGLATKAFQVSPAEVCFLSSNAWDVAGAAAFGFRVVWVNRFGQTKERLPAGPEAEIGTLAGLSALLGRDV